MTVLVFEKQHQTRFPMTAIKFNHPITPHLSPRSIHVRGNASTGSDECGHERDERLVRKYNKEVAVYVKRKLSLDKAATEVEGRPARLLGIGRVKSPNLPEGPFPIVSRDSALRQLAS